jgi:Flp pilus assembly protein TadG
VPPHKPLGRGAVAVEMAVVLPLLILLIVGIVESTNLIYLKQSLTISAYEGVRAAITTSATTADVADRANQIIADRKVKGSSIAIIPADFQAAGYGTYISVKVSAAYGSNSLMPGWFFTGTTLSSEVKMMKEY